MNIKIHSKLEINHQFQDYIKEKIQKLQKFIFDEGSVEFYIKKDGPFYISEVNLHTKSFTIFLKEKEHDLNKCVELLIDKLKTKLSKIHDKIIDKTHIKMEE